ncbi:Glyoxalase/bleomycin resistance protein/dioxygenase [unidentified eubacterium SCB49]|nr:Glyoxalase/bleomycin resistance protein/dioxygenase [unidentified eubacterium SCB49]
MTPINPFHLAIPVTQLEKNRIFYRDILGCEEGRSSDHWVDFNFFGHQLVIHLSEDTKANEQGNPVDGHNVPVPHFGVVLSLDDFEAFAKKLKLANVVFIIEPYTRFKGLTGEQSTMFLKDPSGNALEFKAFKNIDQLFAK